MIDIKKYNLRDFESYVDNFKGGNECRERDSEIEEALKAYVLHDCKGEFERFYIANVAVSYAILNGQRWPEAEPKILHSDVAIHDYCDKFGCWPEAEPEILKSRFLSRIVDYAVKSRRKGDWPEAEPRICGYTDEERHCYAIYCNAFDKRWSEQYYPITENFHIHTIQTENGFYRRLNGTLRKDRCGILSYQKEIEIINYNNRACVVEMMCSELIQKDIAFYKIRDTVLSTIKRM